ncbi:glycosyltransferase family 4 protein [Hymenobacter tenuis]
MKIAFITSGVDRMETLEQTLSSLKNRGEQLLVIQLNPASDKFSKFLNEQDINTQIFFVNSTVEWFFCVCKIFKALKVGRFDLIHNHFFLAGILGACAGRLVGIPKIIYTRHHGNEHHSNHTKGVIIDKITNYLSTRVIAISPSVLETLNKEEDLSLNKIELIPHGLDFANYEQIELSRVQNLKYKYNIEALDYPVLGVVARYDKPKGHEYIIEAFQNILLEYPKAKLILANARGPYKDEVKRLLSFLPKNSFVEINYEYDIIALYKSFDVFIHVPTSAQYESFGLGYLEALALSLPSVFTISGIASVLVKHNHNALVVPYSDSHAICEAVKYIVKHPDFAHKISNQGKEDVRQKFAFTTYFERLTALYTK